MNLNAQHSVLRQKQVIAEYPYATWAGPFTSPFPDFVIPDVTPRQLKLQVEPKKGKKAIQVCSGAYHRASVVPILHNDGYEIVFLDPDQRGVDFVNKRPSYTVQQISTPSAVGSARTITNYRALNVVTEAAKVIREISTADIITCYTSPRLFDLIVPLLARAICLRDPKIMPNPLAIIQYTGGHISEGAVSWANTLLEPRIRRYCETRALPINKHINKITYIRSITDHILPRGHSSHTLNVEVASFHQWCLVPESSCHRPEIHLARYVDHYRRLFFQKLYTADIALIAVAYFAFERNYYYIHDAMRDEVIYPHVCRVLRQTSTLLITGMESSLRSIKAEQEHYREMVLERLKSPLNISCYEAGSLLQTNLKDIVIKAVMKMREANLAHDALLEVIEHTLGYQNVDEDLDSQILDQYMKGQSAGNVCSWILDGLPSSQSDPLSQVVVDIVTKVQSKPRNGELSGPYHRPTHHDIEKALLLIRCAEGKERSPIDTERGASSDQRSSPTVASDASRNDKYKKGTRKGGEPTSADRVVTSDGPSSSRAEGDVSSKSRAKETTITRGKPLNPDRGTLRARSSPSSAARGVSRRGGAKEVPTTGQKPPNAGTGTSTARPSPSGFEKDVPRAGVKIPTHQEKSRRLLDEARSQPDPDLQIAGNDMF